MKKFRIFALSLLSIFAFCDNAPVHAASVGPEHMSRHNEAAENALRNARAAQAALMDAYGVYGRSCRGMINSKSGECGRLTGPLNAATKTSVGAMLCSLDRNEKPVCEGITLGDGVTLMAAVQDDAWWDGYLMLIKHRGGSRVYVGDSDSTAVYFCENRRWVGQDGFPVKFDPAQLAQLSPNGFELGGLECGGSPISIWQRL